MTDALIRDACMADAQAIADIYNHYIEHSTATFDTEPKTAEERLSWLDAHGERYPVLVAEIDGRVVAWGSLTAWSPRPAYAPAVEVSTYVAPDAVGRGLGPQLMEELVECARRAGHRALLSQVVSENEHSLRVTERMGFERVGLLREVGLKFGRRLDVVILERLIDQGGLAERD
ncbi:MAG: N-acetyltransferase family protein [Actinomycetota bacterium]|nr:N-acetyltransferase family protein [Actinomycetota bacterium]